VIPLKLGVRNFLCYRDNVPPLLFEGIHVACLSGDNGHGKSALLDAMTWALWGQARAKADDELIYAAAADMEVEFEFMLDNVRYRVLRKQSRARSARQSGHTSLELQVGQPVGAQGGEMDFRTISGDSLRETQSKINSLLRMDYQTFINSAFLLQGRADEFTKKGPAERKRVLGDILGLTRYEVWESRAKEEARAREVRLAELRRIIADLERELEGRPRLEQELARAQDDLRALEEQVQSQESALHALREEKRRLDLQGEQLAALTKEQHQAQGELRGLEEQISKHQQRIIQYEALLAQQKGVEEGYAAFLACRQRHEELSERASRLLTMNEVKRRLELAIEEAHNSLQSQEKVAQSLLADLEPKAASQPPLERKAAEARGLLEALVEREKASLEKRERVLELVGQLEALRSANQRLHGEMQELREKVDLLGKGQARCPLCQTELGEESLRNIQESYTRQGQAMREDYLARQTQIKELTARQQALQKEVEGEEEALRRERESLQRQVAALERDLEQAQEAARRAAKTRAELDVVQRRLASRDYATEQQKELAKLQAQIDAIGYSPAEHEEVRQRLAQLAPYEAQKRDLEEAAQSIAHERKAKEQTSHMIELWQGRLEEISRKMGELQEGLERLPRLSQEVQEAEATLEGLRARQAQARQEVGAARQRLEHCEQLEKQRRARLRELDQTERERSIYEELATAFGKKGIQAMIIEASIPEIEEEANALLSRMTDNRMQVKMETQRDTKKGGTVETLDIKVQDELGTRNYELFSGGEAFRINFALRVALSKMLARRAGAQLRMLVVDEGFGTQDAFGRERLVEAINLIQEDFDKILVITHIQELKDLFPVRIEVVKTAEGSSFYLS
jgi:exonuclease SbcC